MEKLNGIIYNGRVYITEEAKKPCEGCNLKYECTSGSILGLICSRLDLDKCLRYSQSLTDKLNK